MASPLSLSTTQPDFESLVLQLQLYLQAKGSWVDLLTSSTGQTLIEMMSAVGTFNQFAIESAAREGFPITAVRDSSNYAAANFLGVRVSRKSPASTTVTLTRTDSASPLSIPRFSAFTVNGQQFFNRTTISFDAGSSTTTATLYEGTIKTQTFQSDATTFRSIYLNENGFVVSDSDVDVYLTNAATGEKQLWTATADGIWIAGPFDAVYYDNTTGDGDVSLTFGDGNHGMLPNMGYNIVVNYAVTTGSAANNGQSGLQVGYVSDTTVTGLTTSVITGGSDEKPASYYAAMGPFIFRARKRSVNPTDYRAIASEYPGVASVTVVAQKDIAPNDLRWMNVVRICILPMSEDKFSSIEWADFLDWMQNKKHAAIHIQTFDPVKFVVDISIKLALSPSVAPADIVPTVKDNITNLFTRNMATLGRRVALSDITHASKIAGVDYVEIVTPTVDQVPLAGTEYFTYYALGQLNVQFYYTERTT